VLLNSAPHDFLRNFIAPRTPISADAPKNPSVPNPRSRRPKVDRSFNPIGHGHSPYVPSFADKINNCPMFLATLEMIKVQLDQFAPS
jgi:hypothetical protein